MSAPTLRETLERLAAWLQARADCGAYPVASAETFRTVASELRDALAAPGGCHDCGVDYEAMHDFIIPLRVWERISPTGDEGGILCANCIVARLDKAGIREVPGAYMSGPVRTVDAVTMDTLRQAENLGRTVFPGGDLHAVLAAPPASEGAQECECDQVVPYGDGKMGRCLRCGDDSFPMEEDDDAPAGEPLLCFNCGFRHGAPECPQCGVSPRIGRLDKMTARLVPVPEGLGEPPPRDGEGPPAAPALVPMENAKLRVTEYLAERYDLHLDDADFDRLLDGVGVAGFDLAKAAEGEGA